MTGSRTAWCSRGRRWRRPSRSSRLSSRSTPSAGIVDGEATTATSSHLRLVQEAEHRALLLVEPELERSSIGCSPSPRRRAGVSRSSRPDRVRRSGRPSIAGPPPTRVRASSAGSVSPRGTRCGREWRGETWYSTNSTEDTACSATSSRWTCPISRACAGLLDRRRRCLEHQHIRGPRSAEHRVVVSPVASRASRSSSSTLSPAPSPRSPPPARHRRRRESHGLERCTGGHTVHRLERRHDEVGTQGAPRPGAHDDTLELTAVHPAQTAIMASRSSPSPGGTGGRGTAAQPRCATCWEKAPTWSACRRHGGLAQSSSRRAGPDRRRPCSGRSCRWRSRRPAALHRIPSSIVIR